jgi:N-sulfoglucosamine sulfohydrolase
MIRAKAKIPLSVVVRTGRRFHGSALFVAIVVELCGSALAANPNIVLVFADDLGRHAGVYGRLDERPTCNRILFTPNIDRLAAEGGIVRQAFVSAPSCTPSRSALVSGAHFWRAGRAAILSGAVWDGSVYSLPLALQDHGYHIGKTYKVWSPGSPQDGPFLDGTPGGHAYEQAGRRFNSFSSHATELVEQGLTLEEARRELLQEIRSNLDQFLSARKGDQPFFYFFGPTNTHRKWERGSGRRLWGLSPDSLAGAMPAFLPNVPEVREDLADYLGEVQAVDAAIGELVTRLRETGDLERTILIVSGDHGAPGFPYGKCDLYDFGTRVPLVIWAGPKSGLKIQPGTVIEELVSLTDLAPTVLECVGMAAPSTMTGRSLAPLLDESRAETWSPRPAIFFGRERHVGKAREGCLPYPMRAIRTHEYLYIRNFAPERWPMGAAKGITAEQAPTHEALIRDTGVAFADFDASPTKAWLVEHRLDPAGAKYYDRAFGRRPAEELYVLATDPDQVVNRAGDPALAAVQAELHEALMAELVRTGDPRIIDGGRYFETPPLAGPR